MSNFKMGIVIGGHYKHYKGKQYKVIAIAKHSETLEDLVIYESLYKNELSQIWARPIQMFEDKVEINGKNITRFELID